MVFEILKTPPSPIQCINHRSITAHCQVKIVYGLSLPSPKKREEDRGEESQKCQTVERTNLHWVYMKLTLTILGNRPLSHEPGSERSLSKRMSTAERAIEASNAEQANK